MSSLICVAGGKGAPGASTVALALALAAGSDRQVTLVDADPDGGGLAARLGASSTPGLVSMSAAGRHGFHPDLIDHHTQALTNSVALLLAPPSCEQTSGALANLGRPFTEALATRASIADVGRWRLRSPASDLVSTADAALLVIHPTLEGVAHARSQLDDLQQVCEQVSVVCVGDRPYGAAEVADALEVDAVAVVPADRRGATLIGSGGVSERWVNRSPLMRSMRALSTHLLTQEPAAS